MPVVGNKPEQNCSGNCGKRTPDGNSERNKLSLAGSVCVNHDSSKTSILSSQYDGCYKFIIYICSIDFTIFHSFKLLLEFNNFLSDGHSLLLKLDRNVQVMEPLHIGKAKEWFDVLNFILTIQ